MRCIWYHILARRTSRPLCFVRIPRERDFRPGRPGKNEEPDQKMSRRARSTICGISSAGRGSRCGEVTIRQQRFVRWPEGSARMQAAQTLILLKRSIEESMPEYKDSSLHGPSSEAVTNNV